MRAMSDTLHVKAHAAGAAGNRPHRRVEIGGGEVAVPWSRAISSSCSRVTVPTFLVLGLAAAAGNAGGLLQQHRRGRVLVTKVKLRSL
jgi:hypothetical protein